MAKKGETYAFDGAEAIGTGNGSLRPGTSVTIREVDGQTQIATIEWDVPSIVKTEKGNEIGTARRAFSLPVTELNTLFTKEP